MNQVRIVTDSTADLPKELVAKYEITVVPLKVIFDGEEPLKDGVDIVSEQFYRRQLEKSEVSKTSQPAPVEFATVYSELSAGGNSIISIHLSSALSGTFQSARMAKEMVPGADIEVIDTKSVSMGLGLIVLEAARAAGEGKTKEDILKIVSGMVSNIQVFFIVDTLEYMARGGRIGKAQAFLGSILNIKPLLFLKDGIVYPYEKVRGKTKAIERLAQIVEGKIGKQKIKCSLVHGMDPEGLAQLYRTVMSRINCNEPIISDLGAVVGTHVGSGVLGIIFIPE